MPEVTMQGLHIRCGGKDTHKGIWQAWDGDTYLAGANGPMALHTMGTLLDNVHALQLKGITAPANAGLKWLPEEI